MAAITILVLAHPAEKQLAMLEELPGETTIAVGNRAEAFERAAADAQVILRWSGKSGLLEQVWRMAPRVRWVHSASAGLDEVLFPALAESDVTLTNGRGVFSEALAEFAIGAVFFFARDFRKLVRNQMVGLWERFDVAAVRGSSVGILGYGDVGRAVARRALGLGMKVLALLRRPELSREDQDLVQVFGRDQLQELLAQSDYVVLAAPLTPETRCMISERELEAMKPGAVVINIGRGALVEERALIGALEGGRIRGAALDVFETEPLAAGHPFYKLENVLLSPHSADHTPGWKERSMRLFLDNFERFQKGQPLINVVDKKRGY